MQLYRDLNGDSGVEAYESGTESIKVRFRGPPSSVYVYTYTSAGRDHVEEMKRLAASGDGLNAYINRHVRGNYASKE